MKAIVQDVYGPADVLELRDVDRPAIGEEEVLVEVRAAGVDPGVWVLMTGTPYLARPMFGLRRPKVAVRGRDMAGVVAAVGSRVTGFAPGDEVYGTCESGSYAEYATARHTRLAPKPAGLSFEQAAVVPISGGTALQAIRTADVRPGQRVMVVGAGGGVGSFAVQIATAAGARVTAVCGPGSADLVRSLGAVDVIDYTREEVDRDGPHHDAIIDLAGCRPLRLLRRALTRRGALVLVGGGHVSRRVLGGMDRPLRAQLIGPFTGHRMRGLIVLERAERYRELTELIESGTVRPVVDRVYPLAEAPEAIRRLIQGQVAGKIAITI
ncbi:NADPH:quinone reductase [Sphaerisporangium melleum]|uniref:NADPH:quinone reductase n=1 Tax=Sphaerisporangium melleum TaxID=321316 RepID=A0A917RBV6_9ACTN|nr:NAD(P)-dependent alcohol dehydrogenase [Sphaerisporangium melleum]GGL00343.1 NADPH:quinone reductase [Sphaerisporangium melleum]GII71226.1 NADPH:quinone reductase [Sphaerisporangium melleum]